jgi:hypothetical protein
MLERACNGEVGNGEIECATGRPKMSLCVFCGQALLSRDDVCAYHLHDHGDDWATRNRIMCDFLHRRVVPSAPSERSDGLDLFVEALDEAVSAFVSP